MEEIARQLERVQALEREGIERAALDGSRADLEPRRRFLDELPPDAAGQVRELSRYDFVDERARRSFQELLASLQRQVVQRYFRDLRDAVQGLGPDDLRRLADMTEEINRMLRDRDAGREPDFDRFRERFGDAFPGVDSLDALARQLRDRSRAMQAVLDSLSPQQRLALGALMDELLADPRLRRELAELARSLGDRASPEGRPRFRPTGTEPLSLAEAMDLMERVQAMEALERQLEGAQRPGGLDRLDRDRLSDLLGEDAARTLDELRSLERRLEDEGFLQRRGDRLELTARAIRRIGQKALEEIFSRLERDAFGRHPLAERGHGGERADDSKRYDFGDPFHLHLERTLMRGVARGGIGTPVRIDASDFEVYRTEHLTRAATVVMLDMSLSMLNNDLWQPAKKVAIALESLIRGQFPRDQLHLVGFSRVAQRLTPEALIELSEWDTLQGTNMVDGLRLARRLLGRSRAANRQIVMVTDGGPTVWEEEGGWYFDWPTNRQTELQTLQEVQRCAREGIAINVFMLADDPDLRRFVGRMATINRGRAFYASPENLGEYVLVDYLRNRQRRVP